MTAPTISTQTPMTPLASNAITCYHFIMAQFLVRNVPENIAVALKKRAKKNGRSTEAELRTILKNTIKPIKNNFRKEADKLREDLRQKGYSFTDSTLLIRQDRDSR